MEDKKALDNYLARLEKCLGPISITERSEIVVEIKSHIEDTLEAHAEETLDSVLKSLGEPEIVANKYLLERGLRPQKPPRSPMIKWLTIGFLGTLTLSLVFFIALVSSFTPLVEVNGKDGKVSILGGSLSIKDLNLGEDFDLSEIHADDSGIHEITENIKKIMIQFSNAKIKFTWVDQTKAAWKCESIGGKTTAEEEGCGRAYKNA